MLGVVPVGTRDPRWFAVDLDVSYTKGSLCLMVHFSVSDTVLASRQLVSGGWSFASSQQASIEATCLAAFALADEMPANAGASTQFLLKSQFADGCWPAFEGDSEGSWTTALSLCYLNGMTDFASAREKASHWLVEERGREAHWFWRWKFKTADRNVSFDPDKYGWPWISGSASWVSDPTKRAISARPTCVPAHWSRCLEKIHCMSYLYYGYSRFVAENGRHLPCRDLRWSLSVPRAEHPARLRVCLQRAGFPRLANDKSSSERQSVTCL